ncbi:MAG: peptidoglycan DD-metalloendopeptidase family protein [Gammaproteobacteria bacterium]|nr:peptidoglycan DD-metalloendopeptidase family protein [Gammaproteobacteria bacterium]
MKWILVLIVFILSACTTRNTPAPISNISSLPNYQVRTKGSIASDSYTVKTGETLYSIAWRAGIDFRQLARINNINKPYQIFPGQQLSLQGQVASASRSQSSNNNNVKSKNHKKTIANKKSEEYGKTQQDQKDIKQTKQDPFPSKVRRWRYPSEGNIIETYSSRENGHNGFDFGGKAGDPIIAAADGKIVYAGSALRGYGNLVIVKHNDDYLSAYAHNRKIKVNEDDWVKAGQLIAEMGDTGSDKVKLHFEIRYRGRAVNPSKYLPKR